MRFDANAQVQDILDSLVQQPAAPTRSSAKVAALYQSFLDEPRVEAAGSTPLFKALADVRGARAPPSRIDR